MDTKQGPVTLTAPASIRVRQKDDHFLAGLEFTPKKQDGTMTHTHELSSETIALLTRLKPELDPHVEAIDVTPDAPED